MAVSVNNCELYGSALKEVENVFHVLNSDKRIDRKWKESITNSMNAIKTFLETYRDEVARLQDSLTSIPAHQPLYSDIVKSHPKDSQDIKKLKFVLDKNKGFQTVRQIARILSGEEFRMDNLKRI